MERERQDRGDDPDAQGQREDDAEDHEVPVAAPGSKRVVDHRWRVAERRPRPGPWLNRVTIAVDPPEDQAPRPPRAGGRGGAGSDRSPTRREEVSELYPHLARHVDKLCFLRGLHADTPAHRQAVIQLHTGTALASLTRPSLGAWLMYGLGTENQDLPGYITINPPPNFGGAVNYGRAFLPAHFQGTRINDAGYVPNLKPQVAGTLQRKQI
ncbi:MAG TPA: DUF1501 domain-containing protein, partial [Isosphaeraceae bacterium]